MEHLLFSARTHAVDVDRTSLHDVEAFRGIAFAEKVIAFLQPLRDAMAAILSMSAAGSPKRSWELRRQLSMTVRLNRDSSSAMAGR